MSDCDWLEYIDRFDFVCLTETFIDDVFDLSHVFRNCMKFSSPALKLSHQGRKSGGVLVLVKQALFDFVKEIKVDCKNAVFLKLSKDLFGYEKDILYVSTYIPPHGSPFYDLSESSC